MHKLIIYYCFIVVIIMTILGFTRAQDYRQAIPALLFYPLAVYFLLTVFPRRYKAAVIEKTAPLSPSILKKEKAGGSDPNRRIFLKLIGSAGLTVFLFSIFTKKAQAAFFGSVPGPGTVAIKNTAGVAIDPAESQPTDGYAITNIDDGSPSYYGYLNKNGAWYIMKEDSDLGNYRYAKGAVDFTINWGNRKTDQVTYGYFDDIFN